MTGNNQNIGIIERVNGKRRFRLPHEGEKIDYSKVQLRSRVTFAGDEIEILFFIDKREAERMVQIQKPIYRLIWERGMTDTDS